MNINLKKFINVFLLVVLSSCLCACSSLTGGADYLYSYQSQDKIVSVNVHTNREISEGIKFSINPETGEVTVEAGSVSSGPNTVDILGQALLKALLTAYGPAVKPGVN